MRSTLVWCLLLAPCLAACGSTSTDDHPASDAAADVIEAGPCAPEGAWALTLSSDSGKPSQEQLSISADPDAGTSAYLVTFVDRTVPVDACGFPADGGADAAPSTQIASATLDEKTCTLSASFQNSWCYSGEQQCQDFQLSLMFSGNTGSGSASDKGGWCMDQHTQSWDVTAARMTK